jgi:DNA-directed RNA polymerase specialized sigma24 family protein
MDTKTGSEDEAPPPNDLEGWRAAIAGDDLARYRIEHVVEAAQTLGVGLDRQVIDALMGHVSDEMLRWLRRFIGRNHRNEGIDIIEGVHGKMIEAVLRPKSADGVGLRTTFYKRLQFRATDALQDEMLARGRYSSSDDPAGAVSEDDEGLAALVMQEEADVSRLLECIPDPRKRRAFELHMEGCPLSPGKAKVSIAGELGVSVKTAGDWIDEVIALLKEKIGDSHD